jgi:light-regulated signal transduction histidine kinase (bacteriophytochrome)
MMLNYGKEDAERAIKDLNELSFYESKTELPLTSIVSPNKLCNHLASNLQNEFKNVTAMYQTDLPDDFTITTNAEALEALISHLLKYSARFTFNGTLRLSCAEMGDFVRFSVTDTSAGLNNKPKDNFVGMFSEHGNVIRYVGMNFNICQSITRLLHGRIWRDIAYTNGTRFCFEIPKKL